MYLPGSSWVLTLSSAIWSIGGAVVNPYQSIFFSAVGASPIFIGYLLSVSSLLTALVNLLGGYAADVWGRRKIIIVFSFISAVTAFIYIFITEFQLLVFPMMISAVTGIYSPAFNALLNESMEPELRARGRASFVLLTSIPSVFCPYIGGLLMSRLGTLPGLRVGYFMSGLFGVIGVSYRALRLKETYPGNGEVRSSNPLRFVICLIRSNLEALRESGSETKMLLLYSVFLSAGSAMAVPYTSLFVIENLGLSPDFYGLMSNIAGMVQLLFLLPATAIIERVGLRKSMILASASIPFNQILFVRAKGFNDVVSWSILDRAGSSILDPSLSAYQTNMMPIRMRGRLTALFTVLPVLSSIPAQIAGGALYKDVFPVAPFLCSIPLYTVAIMILILFLRESNRLEP